ncbi:MAG: coiled-coil domain-containing protein [Lewinella sp.]
MKDLLFSLTFMLLLVLAGSHVLSAQVTSQRMTMSRGANDAMILELPSADEKMVGKLWPDWLKDNFKVKTKRVKKTKNELSHLNFSIPGVSTGTKLDMYSSIRTSGGGSELTVWIATTDGYISPEIGSGRYIEAEKMLMRFALAVSKAQIEMQIEEEEKALKDLEKELEKIRKDKEKLEQDIVDAERAIEKARGEIENNLGEQDNKSREIEAQIEKIEATKRKLKDF